MSKEQSDLPAIIITGVACIFCAAFFMEYICESSWRREAIARGVAGYDEQTGEWKWTVERKVAE